MSDHHLLSWLDSTVSPASPIDEVAPLIAGCLNGEEAAFIALYNQFSSTIYRLAYSMLQNQQDAEEVLQDSFEYAFRRLDHYDARKAAFKTWLYQITISRCRNKRRRKWLPSVSLQQLNDQEARDLAAAQPDERAVLSERQRLIWTALGELSPKLREVAILRYYAGLQYAEIGQILGIPPKTAESRMRLAHKALREWLNQLID
jgi:RNA polymerase sigma-70 factor (ECF subfamily)